jgi:diacylglycerol kinase
MVKPDKQNVFKTQVNSFKYAFEGLALLFRKERNAKIHFAAALLVLIFGIVFDISSSEWCIVVLCIAVVMALEGMNTAVEHLADTVTAEQHPGIKKVKDVAAGAVLLAAIGAFIIGLIIFLPKVLAVIV